MIQTLNFETLSTRKQYVEHNNGVAAHEAKICAIMCKNHTFKQKPQDI